VLGLRVSVVIGVLAALVASASATPLAARQGQLTEDAWVSRTLAHMSLAEKVGQLFVVNAYGQSVTDADPQMVAFNRQYYGVDTIEQLIQKYHPGGIVYFNWTNNLQNPAQILALSNGIQQVALRGRTPVPMLLGTDQEQGIVLRIGPPATVFPGNMALGAVGDVGLARQAAVVTANELRAMGINLNYAPVVDVNVNPLNQADGVRSYGDRTAVVSGFAAAQVAGYQTRQATTGVAATAKHFPGLGATTINSDNGVSVSEQTLAQLTRVDLPPFAAAIKAGLDQVMVGHIVFPNIRGATGTTSLSRFYVTELLRRRLHFDGPVITDALNAGALAGLTPAQVALAALRAGDDQLLELGQTGVDTGTADLVPAYAAVMQAVRSHRITEKRIDQSVTRVLRLKWKLGLVQHPITDPARLQSVVGTPQHLALAQQAAERSITLLRNGAGVLPLAARSGKKVLVTGFGVVTTSTIAAAVGSRGLTAQAMPTGSAPNAAAIAGAVAAAGQSDLVIASTYNAWGSPGQVSLVNALLATGKPVVVVAVGTPYDVAYLPGAATFVTTYDYQPVSLQALVRVLFGEVGARGELPVTVTEPPPSTKVLYPYGYGLSLGS
jgi:beta-N-acetylhexosaminidase